ncbi:MAG TPA: carbonic anhydrase family protein [Thermoanaerobaculia bacterium]|nr:carbonic anhydrase family protein [Thermoanaerobaculia bacterium]
MRLSIILLGISLSATAFAADNCATYSYCDIWGGTCATGQQQSPIVNNAAQRRKDDTLTKPGFFYSARVAVIITNTKTMLNVTAYKHMTMTYGGSTYTLVDFHFHTPPEHVLDVWNTPRRAAAELHLVHKKADGATLLVAIPIFVGESNAALSVLKLFGRPKACDSVTTGTDAFAMGALLPANTGSYVTYIGSLTTPPCTEGVRFILMNNGITATQDEIDVLKVGMSARPAQNNTNSVTYRVEN